MDTPAPAVAPPRDRALDRARWELAALTGRLRLVEAGRDDRRGRPGAPVSDRDRQRDLIRARQRSGSEPVGRARSALARDPVRTVRRLRRGSGRPADPVPAHVYLAFGLAHEDLGAFLRAVRQRVVVDADHVPVVVTDCPTFRDLRLPGVVLEYVPDPGTERRNRPGVCRAEVLADRLARLVAGHGCARTVIVDRDDPPTLADLLRAS